MNKSNDFARLFKASQVEKNEQLLANQPYAAVNPVTCFST